MATLYMDHHVPHAITVGLRVRDLDVLTALENGASELKDPALLDGRTTTFTLEHLFLNIEQGISIVD